MCEIFTRNVLIKCMDTQKRCVDDLTSLLAPSAAADAADGAEDE